MIQRTVERQIDKKSSWKVKKEWQNYDQLTYQLKKAVIAGEDAKFFSHYGFDFKAIEKAYKKNKIGKTVHGGSTISQQTAKNVFLWPGRSWLRKCFETYFTILIELFWSKERILEIYLNVIEFGDGIYGAETAAQSFFHKSANRLKKSEVALLVAVLPNPLRWSPIRPNKFIRYKQQFILHHMQKIKSPIL